MAEGSDTLHGTRHSMALGSLYRASPNKGLETSQRLQRLTQVQGPLSWGGVLLSFKM